MRRRKREEERIGSDGLRDIFVDPPVEYVVAEGDVMEFLFNV